MPQIDVPEEIFIMKSSFFWDITPCSSLKVIRRFGVTSRLHFQGRSMHQTTNHREADSKTSLRNESYNMETFITTAVRTLNLIISIRLYLNCF
jgi:hypothetical protein